MGCAWIIGVLSLGACEGATPSHAPCVDDDGDGVCATEDCNDADSDQAEACDPCPGAPDCSNDRCDNGCPSLCAGLGCEEPFLPGPGGALDAVGAFVADPAIEAAPNVIWLDDARAAGLLTRADPSTFELGPRYRIRAEPGTMGGVVMDAFGDAYVPIVSPNRTSLTKVMFAGCEDRNGDGVVATSSGFDDVLPLGEDECVAWTADLGFCPGCPDDTVAVAALTDGGNAIWAGIGPTLDEVDAVTGGLTGRDVYLFWDNAASLVADGAGRLWFLGAFGLQRLDLGTLSQSMPILYGARPGRVDFDSQGGIWLTYLSTLHRHDAVTETDDDSGVAVRDFAIAGDERAWALSTHSLLDVDLTSFEAESHATEIDASGLALDLAGHVWTASRSTDGQLAVFDASTGEPVAQYECAEPDGEDCVMARLRGDPAGVRFLRAFGGDVARARASRVFDTGCPSIREESLQWETGDSGHVHFEARSAATADGLPGMAWVPLGSTPPTEGSVDVLAAFSRFFPSRLDRFLEVRAELRGEGASLQRLHLDARCGP